MFKKQQKPAPTGSKQEEKIIIGAFTRRGWHVAKVEYTPNQTIIANKPGRTVRFFFDSRQGEWIFVEGHKVTRKFKKFLTREDCREKTN